MLDMSRYFVEEHQFYLNSINYNLINGPGGDTSITIQCNDSLSTRIIEKRMVEIIFIRKLDFKPSSLFELTVSFGAKLEIKDEYKEEIDWDNIDLVEELKRDGGNVVPNLVSRASLLISEITASFGQAPIITPPVITNE